MFFLWGANQLGTATGQQALRSGGEWNQAPGAKETIFYNMPVPGILKNFFLRSRTTGAGAGTVTGTVYVNAAPDYSAWVATSLSVSVSQNSNLESQNTSDTVSVGKGDRVAIVLENSVAGTTAWEEPSATVELIE